MGAEIITPEPLGPEPIRDHGVLEPSAYLTERWINLTNFIHEGRRQGFPGVTAQVPRGGEWHSVVERPLDLSATSQERALTEKLVEQDEVEVRWVNEGVTVTKQFTEGLRQWWRETLDQTVNMSSTEWMALLVSVRHDFSEWPGGAPPRMTPKRRTAQPPVCPVPYFARRTGAIPRSGHVSAAGLPLGKGSRRPSFAPAYWVSNEPVDDAAALAGRFAQAFPQTGVWPLLWLCEEDPDAYLEQPGDADLVDATPVESVLPRPLADASPPAPAQDLSPFARLPAIDRARLLLVPCNRPADAIAVIGGLACEMTGPEISAVIRSWEERFSAVLVAAEPSLAWLAVESPPRELEQASMLAAEFDAFCPRPPDDELETVTKLAAAMTAADSARQPATAGWGMHRHLWPVGWHD